MVPGEAAVEEHDQQPSPRKSKKDNKTLRLVVEALKQVTENNRLLAEQMHLFPRKPDDQADEPVASTAREPRWVIERWRTYAGFREHMLEHEARGDLHPTHICALQVGREAGGESARNIARAMNYYHLVPHKKYWPPSRWPEQQPPASVSKIKALLAAASGGIGVHGLLDAADGKLDGVVHACRLATHVIEMVTPTLHVLSVYLTR